MNSRSNQPSYIVTSKSYEIDPKNLNLLKKYKENFAALYNSLSGESEAVTKIKKLLESILEIEKYVPSEFALAQNYPNPFNPKTKIRFSLPEQQNVTLTVYNMLGQVVLVLIKNKQYDAGQHIIEFNAKGLSSGMYIYTMKTEKWHAVRKMLILK